MAKNKQEKAGKRKNVNITKSSAKPPQAPKKQVSERIIPEIEEKPKIKKISEKKDIGGPAIVLNTSGNKYAKITLAFAPLAFALLYLFIIWTVPEKRVVDDWYAAFEMIQKSFQTDDPAQKQKLLDTGGKRLQELTWKYPRHARVHFFTGIYYAIIGKLDSAAYHQKLAIYYGEGALVNQVDHDARAELVRISAGLTQQLLQQGQVQQAKNMLWETLFYAPQSFEVLNNLGIVSNNSGRLDSAVYYFDLSLKYNPDQPEIKRNIGFTCMNYGNNLMQNGNYNEAVNLYEKGVAHIKDNPALYGNLGRAYMLLNQKDKAIENFKDALQLDPNHAFSKNYLMQLQ